MMESEVCEKHTLIIVPQDVSCNQCEQTDFFYLLIEIVLLVTFYAVIFFGGWSDERMQDVLVSK